MRNHLIKRVLAVVASLISLLFSAHASEMNSSKINWNSFQAGALGAVQDEGSSGSAIFRYDPYYQLSENFTLGLSADISYLHLDSDTQFFASTYLANVGYKINPEWAVQGSYGLQNWTCDDCESKPAAGIMVRHNYTHPSASWIDDVWVQYLQVMQEPRVDQYILGVSFNL